MLDNFGSLSVRTYTAGGALPVANATVRIRGADEDNRFISYSLITDEDGMTVAVELPTYNKELSLTPEPEAPPYATYNIEVFAEGYTPKRIMGVPIFSGVYSLQPVSLLPHSSGGVDASNEISNITIPDSELL